MNIELNIVACPTYPDKFTRDTLLHCLFDFRLASSRCDTPVYLLNCVVLCPVLPFVKNAEENSTFAMYFSRQWQDTMFLSLHNFLSVVLSTMRIFCRSPSLLTYSVRCQFLPIACNRYSSILSSIGRWSHLLQQLAKLCWRSYQDSKTQLGRPPITCRFVRICGLYNRWSKVWATAF